MEKFGAILTHGISIQKNRRLKTAVIGAEWTQNPRRFRAQITLCVHTLSLLVHEIAALHTEISGKRFERKEKNVELIC